LPQAVVACTDDAMLAPAFCALYSAWLNSRRELAWFLILTNVSPQGRSEIATAAAQAGMPLQLIDHNIDPDPHQDFRRYSFVTMVRLDLDRLLPIGLQRVLYLDCDLLVRADVAPLLNTQMNGKSLAAVDDLQAVFLTRAKKLVVRRKKIGMPAGQGYFNAGVMLFDWPRTLQTNLLPKARALASQRSFDFLDQDVLNLLLAGDWHRLHHKWNTVASFAFRDEKAAILHFAGSRKPWSINAGHYRKRFAAEYRKLLAQTPWPDFVKGRPTTLSDLWSEAINWIKLTRFRITKENEA
jgi:lipopolysaccharide biosynthesis glycosyltransferase